MTTMEDVEDVAAAKTVRDEVQLDVNEFDENQPTTCASTQLDRQLDKVQQHFDQLLLQVLLEIAHFLTSE